MALELVYGANFVRSAANFELDPIKGAVSVLSEMQWECRVPISQSKVAYDMPCSLPWNCVPLVHLLAPGCMPWTMQVELRI